MSEALAAYIRTGAAESNPHRMVQNALGTRSRRDRRKAVPIGVAATAVVNVRPLAALPPMRWRGLHSARFALNWERLALHRALQERKRSLAIPSVIATARPE